MRKIVHDGCCMVQGDIEFCRERHTYLHVPTKKKLTPVSHVIQRVYSTKSWDGVDPAVVENARRRGDAVDGYMARYVREQRVVIAAGERSDVVERLVVAHRVWETNFSGMQAESQKIVFSVEDEVAGTMDFHIPGIVVDLKCTYYTEVAWILQLGAYGEYSQSDRGGIIHVSPKTYPEGGRWLEYDMDVCKGYWRQALAWWKQTKSMEAIVR